MHPSTSPRASRCVLALICLALCLPAVAQGTGGRILGRVSDPSGAVLAGVNITLTNQATSVSRTVQCNPELTR
jgi:hypothetical protein